MNRRKLIIYGTGMPAALRIAKWTAPIISAVALPAHAQTSCSATASSLFRVTNQQGFDFVVSESCATAVIGSTSSSADLIIELDTPTLMGTVRAANITMNYSQTTSRHAFLPDSQSGNVPFTIELDDYEVSTGAVISVSLELNYFEIIDTLEVTVLLIPN